MFFLHILRQYIALRPVESPALKSVPVDWMSQLPGKLIVAAHAAIVPSRETEGDIDALSNCFADNALIGAEVSGGAAKVYTDFRIHVDGFGRFLILDEHLKKAQAGRLLQRLFEIEVYRVMALLAFPIAWQLTPVMINANRLLVKITAAMATVGCDDGKCRCAFNPRWRDCRLSLSPAMRSA